MRHPSILIFLALLAIGGCATQEPVKIVDAACHSATCEAKLAQANVDLQKCNVEKSVCTQALQKAEACCSQKDAALKQLQAEKDQLLQARGAVAERDAQLAKCQGDLAALNQKAQADAAACNAMGLELDKYAKAAEGKDKQAQRMRDLEKGLRQRLQTEIGNRDVEIEQLRSQLTVRVLDRILFESGSAEILPQGRRVLDAVGAALKEGDETIRIEGHADTVPIGPTLKSKYYSNWELSTGRSSSVVRYFEEDQGIAPTRLEAVGYSKYRPIAPNDTEANRQRNRRVEIVLTPWKPDEAGMAAVASP